MILYSVMPPEIVLGNIDNFGSGKQSLIELYYKGEKIEASPLENNTFRVNRIISSNPKAYLNPRLQPGSVIKSGLI